MTFNDLPRELKRDAAETAKAQLGAGYTPDYYISVINDWLWLYEAGMEAGKAKGKGKA